MTTRFSFNRGINTVRPFNKRVTVYLVIVIVCVFLSIRNKRVRLVRTRLPTICVGLRAVCLYLLDFSTRFDGFVWPCFIGTFSCIGPRFVRTVQMSPFFTICLYILRVPFDAVQLFHLFQQEHRCGFVYSKSIVF